MAKPGDPAQVIVFKCPSCFAIEGQNHLETCITQQPRLTRREEFAMSALRGILSNSFITQSMAISRAGPEGLVADSVRYADMMIDELRK